MRLIDLINEIKDYSKTIGIDDIGFGSARLFFNIENILVQNRKSGNYTEFETNSVIDRVYPSRSLESAKSIIVLIEKGKIYKPEIDDRNVRGIISICARGEDYHRILKRKLELLCNFIDKKYNKKSIYQVDTGPIVERAAAVRCNLGWIGKNNCFYDNNYGSFVFIGCIITELDLPVIDNNEFRSFCGTCKKCIDHCPANALTEEGIDIKKCISYNSVTKDNFNFAVMDKFSHTLYGCDVCQLVCPFNKTRLNSDIELDMLNGSYYPLVEEVLNISTSVYKKKYQNTAIYWRGKKILMRNALIIIIGMDNQKYKMKIFDKILIAGANEYLKNFLLKALEIYDIKIYNHYQRLL